MMIYIIMFLVFFLMNLKEYTFLSAIVLMDPQAMSMVVLTPLILMLIFSMKFMSINFSEKKSYKCLFFSLIMLLNLIFLVNNSFFFFMALELCIYPMMMLMLNFSKDKDKMKSMILMFSLNIVGSVPFILFIKMVQESDLSNDSTNLEILITNNLNSNLIYMLYSLMLISKLPLMFLHFWLNKAHVSASGPSSMILASLMLKLGTFGLFKYYYNFISVSVKNISYTLPYAIMSMFVFSMIMVRFFDIKYFIACSSIVHMAMIFPMIGFSKSMSITSAVFMMVSHGIISCLMFYFMTIMYENSHNRSIMTNKSLESVSKLMSYLFLILMVINMGVPPFMNFYSEMMTLMSVYFISVNLSYLLVMAMILPIIYVFLISGYILFGKKTIKSEMLSSASVINNMICLLFMLITLPMIS